MLTEDNVLFLVKEYLIGKGWEVIYYKAPGGHGGITIKINENRSVILDIIAYCNPFILCLEAKAKYSDRDKDKLNYIFSDTVIFQNLRNFIISDIAKKNILVNNNTIFIKALAYSTGNRKIEDFVIFKVKEPGNITLSIGENVPIQISKVL